MTVVLLPVYPDRSALQDERSFRSAQASQIRGHHPSDAHQEIACLANVDVRQAGRVPATINVTSKPRSNRFPIYFSINPRCWVALGLNFLSKGIVVVAL